MTSEWQPIETAPRDPGVAVVTDIGVVGWAQELWKAPPPFLERGVDWVPQQSREGGWCRMVWSDVLGWAFTVPMDIVHPNEWRGLASAGQDLPSPPLSRKEPDHAGD